MKWLKKPTGEDYLIEVINYVGAKPVFMSAQDHDKAAAMISHMPMLISQALMLAAKRQSSCNLRLHQADFRDTDASSSFQ